MRHAPAFQIKLLNNLQLPSLQKSKNRAPESGSGARVVRTLAPSQSLTLTIEE